MPKSSPKEAPVADESADAAQNAGGLILAMAIIGGLGWLAGACAFLYSYVGLDQFRAMAPALQAGLILLTALPAFLIWFAGVAAREGARARKEARRLANAADRLLSPAPAAEAAARRLGVSVRGEIAALERAIDQALAKAKEVEQLIARQTLSMDSAVAAAASGANQMVSGMERERTALLQIAEDLNVQAASIGESISRHTRLIADAARTAEREIRNADDALDSRLSSFGAAAALISDRTGALASAAQHSAESALKLENVLGGALDALTKATNLTDAARQSAEAATSAANHTAGAVRDTTLRAVEDAKRAADMIRQEAASVENEAEAALERLREAADAARAAAQGARAATGASSGDVARFASAGPSRAALSPSGSPGQPGQTPSPGHANSGASGGQSAAARRADIRREAERARAQAREDDNPSDAAPDRARARSSFGEAMAGVARAPAPRSAPAAAPAPASPGPADADAEGARWTWREVLANIDADRTPAPSISGARASNGAAGRAGAERGANEGPGRMRHPVPSVGIIEAAGLRLGEVFNLSTLDRIAQRARNGTQARRRAVRDASPEAVRRLSDYLERDQEARAEATEFMRNEGARIAELLGRGRASMSADATRAYLLIDAASS